MQIEQLSERRYPAQQGRKDRIIQHLEKHGYKLLSLYTVQPYDTDDIIMTRNVDEFLVMTAKHGRDGNGSARFSMANNEMSAAHLEQLAAEDQERRDVLHRPAFNARDVMQLRKASALESIKERRRESLLGNSNNNVNNGGELLTGQSAKRARLRQHVENLVSKTGNNVGALK